MKQLKILLILSQFYVLSSGLLNCNLENSNSTEGGLRYFEKFGKSYDKKLRQGDDIHVIQEFIFKFKFFDKYYSNIYITSNGVCYFDAINAINHPRPKPFPIKGKGKVMIAPFWSDIDTRAGGDVYYQIRSDDETLKKIGCEIQSVYKSFVNFKPLYALVVTWHKVRSYQTRFIAVNNTFQLALATNGYYSFLIFNYGDLSWPFNSSRESVITGYNTGDLFNYFMITDLSNRNLSYLTNNSNVGIPSKWIFRVDTEETKADHFIKFGIIMEDKLLEKGDESHSPPIQLNDSIRISDKLTLNSLFVYANGFVTFNSPYLGSSATPQSIPIEDLAIIFPFWSDINILNTGDIYYREIKDQESLNQINTDIGNSFSASWAFVVTYYQVGPHSLVHELNNTFQLVLAHGGSSNGEAFYAIFNYDRLNWPNSHFRQSFECGFNLDIDHYYLLSQHEVSKNSNVNKSGKYVFRLDRLSKTIEFEAYTQEEILEEKNSSSNPTLALIILIIFIGFNSAFNSFFILWQYLTRKVYTPQAHIMYTKKLSDSTTILMHEEQQCE